MAGGPSTFGLRSWMLHDDLLMEEDFLPSHPSPRHRQRAMRQGLRLPPYMSEDILSAACKNYPRKVLFKENYCLCNFRGLRIN